jgi:hypothetical protein
MNLRGIDLNLLVFFDSLMTERSITGAARQVGISPQGDEELARQGDGGRLAHPPAKAPDPLVEPQAVKQTR